MHFNGCCCWCAEPLTVAGERVTWVRHFQLCASRHCQRLSNRFAAVGPCCRMHKVLMIEQLIPSYCCCALCATRTCCVTWRCWLLSSWHIDDPAEQTHRTFSLIGIDLGTLLVGCNAYMLAEACALRER